MTTSPRKNGVTGLGGNSEDSKREEDVEVLALRMFYEVSGKKKRAGTGGLFKRKASHAQSFTILEAVDWITKV